MNELIKINGRVIGKSKPVYIVAEISSNHNKDFNLTIETIKSAKACGADAVKVQTYKPDTITLNCKNSDFMISGGTLWDNSSLYDLYEKAYMPWEWLPKLKDFADSIKIDFFSTPFDFTAVDYLEKINVCAYKISSFEIVDLPLIERIAKTKKPIIISTGMATLDEIKSAISVIKTNGGDEIALLKCTSSYPAPDEDMNLLTITDMMKIFNVPIGISDHTTETLVPSISIALGAVIIEKHFALSKNIKSPDIAFSLDPKDFKTMVENVRRVEKLIGKVFYGVSKSESSTYRFRRSLYASDNIKNGEILSLNNIKSVRPSFGLPPKHLKEILGKKATKDISFGTPITWELISKD